MFTFNYICRFNDCDPAGIMFYGNLFTVIHQCYESWLHQSGYAADVFANPDLAFPIISTKAEYRKPIALHTQVKVQMVIPHHSEHAFTIAYELLDNNEVVCAKAETVHVCINKQTGQKTGLPEFLKKLFTC